jgi:hypothetical protein
MRQGDGEIYDGGSGEFGRKSGYRTQFALNNLNF